MFRSRLTSDNSVVRFFDLDTRLGVGDCVVVEVVLVRPAVGRSLGSIRALVGVQTICKTRRASRNANRVEMRRWADEEARRGCCRLPIFCFKSYFHPSSVINWGQE